MSKGFAPRASSGPASDPLLPSGEALFRAEVAKIRDRIEKVVSAGHGQFFDGSSGYDHATVAVLRLAALFDDDRFAPFLTAATDTERRGILATRNIAAHRGYAAMNDDVFWETVTVQVPGLLDRIDAANRA